jgi:hypothetical protein
MGNYSIEEYSQLAERIFSKDFQLVPLLDGNERKGPAGTANNDDYGFQNLMEKLRSIKRDLNRAKAKFLTEFLSSIMSYQ